MIGVDIKNLKFIELLFAKNGVFQQPVKYQRRSEIPILEDSSWL
jgi:hypothetical protein